MSDPTAFDVQGHRGARGLRPENTLPSFEIAFDVGVSSIETDVHRTRDGVPVLIHDASVSARLCSLLPGVIARPPADEIPVRTLTLAELRAYRADRNPSPQSFPDQRAMVSAFARRFATERGIDPFAVPTLVDLFAFAAGYAGDAGKTAAQRQAARRVIFDLELKRVPYWPNAIGDAYDGTGVGDLERRVRDEAERAGVLDRVRVRSFDHRCVQHFGRMQPGLSTAVLVASTAPVRPVEVMLAAGAELYCPDYRFIDASVVRQIHDVGKRIVPWTVNDPADWERLIAWGVDGITTDFPDHLLGWLRQRNIAVAGIDPR